MPRYENRNTLILGAGRSGEAAARLIQETGGEAAIVDEAWPAGRAAELGAQGICCLHAPREHLPDGSFDLVVASPSFASDHPWMVAARDRGLSVISELELGAAHWRGDVLAVTGSKGKSSVVKCLADTLTRFGRKACTAGNYGTPLAARVLGCQNRGEGTIAVVEVSSFQLEHTRTFAPRLAAVLNIQADHLDRHGTFEAYAAMKMRLFRAQRADGSARAYLPWGISPLGIQPGVSLERFGPQPWCDWRAGGDAISRRADPALRIPLTGYFANPVLAPAAALIAAMLTECGLAPEQIAQGLADFVPLPHRMQHVARIGGIDFVDDSKATSLSATQAALKIIGHDVRLIAGGRLKENDLDFLEEELAECARAVYLIGEAQNPLHAAWVPILPCHRCGTLAAAFEKALADAKPGETILLAPGCASFDQFDGMAARGDAFQTLVRALSAR